MFCKASAAIFDFVVPTIEVPAESDPVAAEALFAEHAKAGQWAPIDSPVPGCAVLFKNAEGAYVHIGLYVQSGSVLHCLGSEETPGKTRYDEIKMLRRAFKTIEYFTYVPRNRNL